MKSNRFSAVILAAGFSSRMGEFKPLLPLGDRTLLEQVVTLFEETGIQDICVVIGHHHTRMCPVVENLRARSVFNPNYRKDMFSSVVSGITTLAPETEAFFIMPVDIPLVRRATIEHLLNAYQESKGHLLYPAFKGSRGHPPLIPFAYAKDIIEWKGKGGLNGALTHVASCVFEVDVPDEHILFDIDTPEDYQQLLKIWHTEKRRS